MRMQYFPTVNILLGTLNDTKIQLLIMHGPRHKRLKSRQIEFRTSCDVLKDKGDTLKLQRDID